MMYCHYLSFNKSFEVFPIKKRKKKKGLMSPLCALSNLRIQKTKKNATSIIFSQQILSGRLLRAIIGGKKVISVVDYVGLR